MDKREKAVTIVFFFFACLLVFAVLRLMLAFSVLALCAHSLGQRSFSYAASSVWNSLPYKVTSSNTLAYFKPALKYHLFSSYTHESSDPACVCVCVRVHVCVRACVCS